MFFYQKYKAIPQTSTNDSTNSSSLPEEHSLKIKTLIEIPLRDPVEAGFKSIKSDLVDSQSVLQLLVLLENAFDETTVKANISKVKEFFGPNAQRIPTVVEGNLDLIDLNAKVLSLSSDLLVNFLRSKKTRYLGLLDRDHTIELYYLFSIVEFFLYRFYHPNIFDPKKAFESMTDYEFEILEKILIDAEKSRARQQNTDQSITFIENLDTWENLRIFINNHLLQRKLLLELCFVSFDSLSDSTFREIFSDFINRPRASPWITNNRLVMVYYYADQIVSLIVKHRLISKKGVLKLNECTPFSESVPKYTDCLDSIDTDKIIPTEFLKNAIFTKFPLWPTSLVNMYEISFLVPKLLENVDQLSEKENQNLPFSKDYRDNIKMFRHFAIKHFSLGVLGLLNDSICKYKHKSPDFIFEYNCSKSDWKLRFSSKSEFVYPLNEIDKLFTLYSTKISEIEQIIDMYTSDETANFTQSQIELITAIANSSRDSLMLLAYEVYPDDPLFKSIGNYPLFALLSDISKFNFIKEEYENERAECDLSFSQLEADHSYSQMYEYIAFISDKEKYSSYIELLNKGILSIMENSV